MSSGRIYGYIAPAAKQNIVVEQANTMRNLKHRNSPTSSNLVCWATRDLHGSGQSEGHRFALRHSQPAVDSILYSSRSVFMYSACTMMIIMQKKRMSHTRNSKACIYIKPSCTSSARQIHLAPLSRIATCKAPNNTTSHRVKQNTSDVSSASIISNRVDIA